MWEIYIEPNLKAQEELEKAASLARATPGPGPAAAKRGTFDPKRATAAEMNTFLEKFCGRRTYTGPKWWRGEGGTQIYTGK